MRCSIRFTISKSLHRGSPRHHRLRSALVIAVTVLSAPLAVFGQTPELERETPTPIQSLEESAAPLAAPDLSSYADPQLDQSLLNASDAAQLSAEDAFDVALQRAWQFAGQQLGNTAAYMYRKPPRIYPMYTGKYTGKIGGGWAPTGVEGWTSGFSPGSLWLMYQQDRNGLWEYQQDKKSWRAGAETWQGGIKSFLENEVEAGSHDLSFVVLSSFGNGYRLTGNNDYRQVMLHAAQLLANRYSPIVGSIRSWDTPKKPDEFQVIIDNMMNLELLFWASKHGGNSNWYEIAKNHALKTILNHVRPNGSTYHLVAYDNATGAVKYKDNVQGYLPETTWSRGQAWAVYGFTMTYRCTKDVRFLETARKTADYFINHLPCNIDKKEDCVPYWDFQAPDNYVDGAGKSKGKPRDSSAAAIAASGLLELSQLETDAARRIKYLKGAKDILRSLATKYLAQANNKPTSAAILLHGTYNIKSLRGDYYDQGTIWGDYSVSFFVRIQD